MNSVEQQIKEMHHQWSPFACGWRKIRMQNRLSALELLETVTHSWRFLSGTH